MPPSLQILTLATVQPISEDDMAAKVAFVTKFVGMPWALGVCTRHMRLL